MTVTMTYSHASGTLTAFGKAIKASCDVRNELNRRRLPQQIVNTKPDPGKPYQPRPFPLGFWTVKIPVKTTEKYLAPWFIPTDARQEVPVWEVKDGKYSKKTDEKIMDKGYGLHYSESRTTLGCIRISELPDLLWLVNEIQTAQANGETIMIEVTA